MTASSSWLTHHVRAVMLVIGGLCALGVAAVLRLPVAIFPDLTVPRIIIDAEGGDAPAQNVLVSVTTLPIACWAKLSGDAPWYSAG